MPQHSRSGTSRGLPWSRMAEWEVLTWASADVCGTVLGKQWFAGYPGGWCAAALPSVDHDGVWTVGSKGTEHPGQLGRIRWLRLRMQAGRSETIKYMPPFGTMSFDLREHDVPVLIPCMRRHRRRLSI
ncbi:hypothetical protein K456DRAFT_1203441 [Colletotrichum gloeosporioides 23]|nr:hypothetical protein K456DRAFT_1203441 [Colletotrichum gloeosporioides 23]